MSSTSPTAASSALALSANTTKTTPSPGCREIIDMPKEKNFFETRVTEYKTGELDW
jgi:hypothetical protein